MMMLKNFSTLCYTHLFLELTLTSIEISQHSASSQITEFHFNQVESKYNLSSYAYCVLPIQI